MPQRRSGRRRRVGDLRRWARHCVRKNATPGRPWGRRAPRSRGRRKVERELEDLSSEWKALRRKRPRFDDVVRANECGTTSAGDDVGTSGVGVEASPLSVWMLSWRELESRVKDEEIFPPEEEDEEEESLPSASLLLLMLRYPVAASWAMTKDAWLR